MKDTEFTPERIKALRTQLGLSQSKFAAALGLSLAAIRHWEQGIRPRMARPANYCASWSNTSTS